MSGLAYQLFVLENPKIFLKAIIWEIDLQKAVYAKHQYKVLFWDMEYDHLVGSYYYNDLAKAKEHALAMLEMSNPNLPIEVNFVPDIKRMM